MADDSDMLRLELDEAQRQLAALEREVEVLGDETEQEQAVVNDAPDHGEQAEALGGGDDIKLGDILSPTVNDYDSTETPGGESTTQGYGSHDIAWTFSWKVVQGPLVTQCKIMPGYIWVKYLDGYGNATCAIELASTTTVDGWPDVGGGGSNVFAPAYRYYCIMTAIDQSSPFSGKRSQWYGTDNLALGPGGAAIDWDTRIVNCIVDFQVSGGVTAGVVNTWIQRFHQDIHSYGNA